MTLSSPPAGDYEIAVKFNDQHIPDSPYLVPVVAPMNDARRLSVTGLQVRHEETPSHPACPALMKGRGCFAGVFLVFHLKAFNSIVVFTSSIASSGCLATADRRASSERL